MRSMKAIITSGVGIAALLAPTAVAQEFYERNRYESVTERVQPEFDPEPVRLGAFQARPVLEVGVESNDNVFATNNDSQSDVIVRLAPGVNVRSDWSRHELNAGAQVVHNEYTDLDDESATTFRSNLRGRVDVSREVNVGGGVFFEDLVESRRSISGQNTFAEPIEYDVFGGEVNGQIRRDRIEARATLRIAEFDYTDVPLTGGGTSDQDFRDQTQQTLTGRLSYAISPDVAFFGQASVGTREFDQTNNGVSRDSEGYSVQAGVNFELPTLLRGDVAVGVLEETPDDPSQQDISGLSLDGQVEWFPTRLTTVTLNGSRRAVDPGLVDLSNGIRTQFGARVDHELRRNVILFASAGINQLEIENDNRDDDLTDFGVGAIYKLNKRAHVEGFYRLYNRESTLVDEFDQNVFGVVLRVFP